MWGVGGGVNMLCFLIPKMFLFQGLCLSPWSIWTITMTPSCSSMYSLVTSLCLRIFVLVCSLKFSGQQYVVQRNQTSPTPYLASILIGMNSSKAAKNYYLNFSHLELQTPVFLSWLMTWAWQPFTIREILCSDDPALSTYIYCSYFKHGCFQMELSNA